MPHGKPHPHGLVGRVHGLYRSIQWARLELMARIEMFIYRGSFSHSILFSRPRVSKYRSADFTRLSYQSRSASPEARRSRRARAASQTASRARINTLRRARVMAV